MLRSLVTALVIGLGIGWSIGLAQAQTPNGYINPPVYGTGLIPESKSGTVTTTIVPSQNHPVNLVVYNIAAITTWTILLPNPPFDGQFITISCTTSVATLIILSTDGSALASGIPNSCAATANVTLQWSSTYNTWYVAGGGSGGGATSTTSIGSALYFARNYGNCTWSSSGDVGPCINLAIAAAAAQGAGTVMVPGGTYGIGTAITQHTSGVHLLGAGVGSPRDNFNASTFQAPTHLIWNGAAHATVFNLEPTPNTGSAESLYDVDVWGITFDCNLTADIGFRAAAVVSSHFNIGGGECQSINILFTTDNITDAPGDQDNDIWAYSRSTSGTQAPTGIMFDSYANLATWNFSFNRVHKAFAWFGNGDGIVIGDSDNNLFDDIGTFRNPTGTGTPVVLANHAYTSPNGITANGHPYSNNYRHLTGASMIAGYQSGSTFISTSGTNSCNGSGDAACGPTSVTLTTNTQTNQLNNTLNFSSTTGITANNAVTCGGSSLGGVLPNELISAVTGTTAVMLDGAALIVHSGTSCVFTYGVTSLAVPGVYTITAASGTTYNITAPAGGHSQSSISPSAGTLTFFDVVAPWTGTATAGDTWTLTVPSSLPINNIFTGIDFANNAPNPRFEYGTTGFYSKTNTAYTTPVGPTGYGTQGIIIGVGQANGSGAVALGGGASLANGQNSFATGPGNNITSNGNGSAALNHNNVVSSQYALAAGDTNTISGNDGFIFGFSGNDHGAILAETHGCVKFTTNGDCQWQQFFLRGTGNTGGAIRLTSDGNAPSFFNCANLPINSTYSLNVTVVATDHTTVGNNETWQNWGMLLTTGASVGTTALVKASTPTPLSNGSTSSISVTADTSEGCLNISVTPPNSDVWNVNSTIQATQVQ